MTFAVGYYRTRRGNNRAFTLVELVLVMTLLVTIIGLAAPKLARFFGGRTLEIEASRFLALTQYGQSQAVSEGVPMILWVDRRAGTYGLRQEGGNSFNSARSSAQQQPRNRFSGQDPWDYQVDPSLNIEIDPNARLTNGLATIRFESDGTIDETSVPLIFIRETKDTGIIPIILSRYHLNYEFAHQTNLLGQWYP